MRRIDLNFSALVVIIWRRDGQRRAHYLRDLQGRRGISQTSVRRLVALMTAPGWACVHRNDLRGAYSFVEVINRAPTN